MILLYLHFKSQIMNIVFGLGMPGGWEWIIIGLIVVIFFGANKIPEIFKGCLLYTYPSPRDDR